MQGEVTVDDTERASEFLSPRLLPAADIQGHGAAISGSPVLEILEEFPKPLLIFTKTRQIVYANPPAQKLFLPDRRQPGVYTGLRLGEALGCIHSGDLDTSLCGTTQYCRYCGAAKALQSAAGGELGADECRITRQNPENSEALDLYTWSRPFEYSGHSWILFFLEDISRQKREDILERFFYHDLINTVSSLKSLLTLQEMEHPENPSQYLPMAQKAIRHLVEEIHSHRDLKAAENRTLSLSPQPLSSEGILQEIQQLYKPHELARGKSLSLDNQAKGCTVITDKTLLTRVLGNMIKNGLEAVKEGESVTIQAAVLAQNADQTLPAESGLRFSVHNPGVIPEAAQAQIFNRSYSTKGKGRGLGTYSMKLLGEYYLGGRVGFTSSPSAGTEFFIELPPSPQTGS